jgi:outer membrane protein assembly factor BamB
LPLRWSATENVAWKTAIPGDGWSSPIVQGDRVFVTSTTDEGRSCHVICVDRRRGKLLWNTKVFEQAVRKKRDENSYATPTPATDGERVYAVFSGGGIAAVDYDGKPAWTCQEVSFYSHHGLAASPILAGDLLVMPFDGSSDGEDNKVGWKIPWREAVLLAVDKRSGEVRWRGKRGLSRLGHVTPNLLRAGGTTQIVSGAGDCVQGFDPQTGELIWSIYSQGEGVTPSIVIGDGLIYSCSGFEAPTIRVVRTGGSGEVTKTHIAWEQTKGVPSLASMLYVKPHVYAVTDAGIATCFDASSGEIVWQERIGGKHSSSPIYADGRIYFLTEAEGETLVIEPGPKLTILATNRIDEKCKASMAVSQGNIFIRSERNLFCIGKTAGTE